MTNQPVEREEPTPRRKRPEVPRWLTPGVWGLGLASFFADMGHEVPTALFASLVTITLGAPAAVLGLIEGLADGLAGLARFAGGALADDPHRRRNIALGGYSLTAILAALIGAAVAAWQVALLRTAAWTSRGLRVPARNALLATVQSFGNIGTSGSAGLLWTLVSPTVAFVYLSLWAAASTLVLVRLARRPMVSAKQS